jgi:hypothetical protein
MTESQQKYPHTFVVGSQQWEKESLTGLGTLVIYIQKNENGNISCLNRRIKSKSIKYLNVRPEINQKEMWGTDQWHWAKAERVFFKYNLKSTVIDSRNR